MTETEPVEVALIEPRFIDQNPAFHLLDVVVMTRDEELELFAKDPQEMMDDLKYATRRLIRARNNSSRVLIARQRERNVLTFQIHLEREKCGELQNQVEVQKGTLHQNLELQTKQEKDLQTAKLEAENAKENLREANVTIRNLLSTCEDEGSTARIAELEAEVASLTQAKLSLMIQLEAEVAALTKVNSSLSLTRDELMEENSALNQSIQLAHQKHQRLLDTTTAERLVLQKRIDCLRVEMEKANVSIPPSLLNSLQDKRGSDNNDENPSNQSDEITNQSEVQRTIYTTVGVFDPSQHKSSTKLEQSFKRFEDLFLAQCEFWKQSFQDSKHLLRLLVAGDATEALNSSDSGQMNLRETFKAMRVFLIGEQSEGAKQMACKTSKQQENESVAWFWARLWEMVQKAYPNNIYGKAAQDDQMQLLFKENTLPYLRDKLIDKVYTHRGLLRDRALRLERVWLSNTIQGAHKPNFRPLSGLCAEEDEGRSEDFNAENLEVEVNSSDKQHPPQENLLSAFIADLIEPKEQAPGDLTMSQLQERIPLMMELAQLFRKLRAFDNLDRSSYFYKLQGQNQQADNIVRLMEQLKQNPSSPLEEQRDSIHRIQRSDENRGDPTQRNEQSCLPRNKKPKKGKSGKNTQKTIQASTSQAQLGGTKPNPGKRQGNTRRNVDKPGLPRFCYACGSKEHFRAKCPQGINKTLGAKMAFNKLSPREQGLFSAMASLEDLDSQTFSDLKNTVADLKESSDLNVGPAGYPEQTAEQKEVAVAIMPYSSGENEATNIPESGSELGILASFFNTIDVEAANLAQDGETGKV